MCIDVKIYVYTYTYIYLEIVWHIHFSNLRIVLREERRKVQKYGGDRIFGFHARISPGDTESTDLRFTKRRRTLVLSSAKIIVKSLKNTSGASATAIKINSPPDGVSSILQTSWGFIKKKQLPIRNDWKIESSKNRKYRYPKCHPELHTSLPLFLSLFFLFFSLSFAFVFSFRETAKKFPSWATRECLGLGEVITNRSHRIDQHFTVFRSALEIFGSSVVGVDEWKEWRRGRKRCVRLSPSTGTDGQGPPRPRKASSRLAETHILSSMGSLSNKLAFF